MKCNITQSSISIISMKQSFMQDNNVYPCKIHIELFGFLYYVFGVAMLTVSNVVDVRNGKYGEA